MSANTAPIFPLTPKISWTTILAANTAKDGTGTVGIVATANPTGNGARLDSIRCRALGTNTATVLRLFLNNGNANSTPTNNSLIYEITLPSTTLTELAAQADIVISFDDIVLPVKFQINATLGTAVAAGWQITAFYGEY